MKKSPEDRRNIDKRFELLRELLLEEDREKFNALNQEILMNEKVAARITPIIDDKIEDLRKKFPEYFGHTITETIKHQIRDSQDDVIDALYPIMGKLIKKSIITELNRLSENINQSIKRMFSLEGRLKWFKAKFSGVSDGDSILQDVFRPFVEEVFIIEKKSGLLLGNHSTGNIANKDMVSGMLTAIKAFAEDAFSKEGQDLEDVKFETFEISIHNFNSIYIAVAFSGVSSFEFRDKLSDNVTDLATIILRERSHLKNEKKLNNLIKEYLIEGEK